MKDRPTSLYDMLYGDNLRETKMTLDEQKFAVSCEGRNTVKHFKTNEEAEKYAKQRSSRDSDGDEWLIYTLTSRTDTPAPNVSVVKVV